MRRVGARHFMIGDQLDRDIVPAARAGYVTIYFPGRFMPFWERRHSADVATYAVTTFAAVPRIIATHKEQYDQLY